MNDGRQWMSRLGRNEGMDVVGHNNPSNQVIALSIEVEERILNDSTDARIAEHAAAVPGIQ